MRGATLKRDPRMSNAAIPKSASQHQGTSTAKGFWDYRLQAFASLVVGVFLGGFIWAFSRVATGHAEPWDAAGSYYLVGLFGAGFVSTLVYSRSCVYGTLGVYLGQAAYITFTSTPGDPHILPVFLSLLLFGLLPALVGSMVPFITRKLLKIDRQQTK